MTIDPRSILCGACVAAALTVLSVRADTTNDYGNADAAYLGKDAAIGLAVNAHGNQGGTVMKCCKGPRYLDMKIFAIFDWNRSNIVASLEAMARTNRWRNLQEAYDHGQVQVSFGLRPSDNPTDSTGTKTLKIGSFDSETAWVEGAGTEVEADYPWPDNTSACTASAAVDWKPGQGTPTLWRSHGVDTAFIYNPGTGLPLVWNTSGFTNLAQNTYSFAPLDATLWWNYLHSTNAGPGLFVKDGVDSQPSGTVGNDNMRIYARESGATTCPKLRVTIAKRQITGMAIILP